MHIYTPTIKLEGNLVDMKRRQILKYVAGVATLSVVPPVAAKEYIDFTPEVYAQALASGQPFMLAFLSDWWPVCRVQEHTVSVLADSNPAYEKITLIRADWDTFRRSEIVKELRIPRRSTLVMFNNGVELARVIAQTNQNVIEELFKAATSQ